jgi:hypothetical protein
MITFAQMVCPPPEVVDTALDAGEPVLLQVERHVYSRLNTMGTQIWQGLKQGRTLLDISRQLQATFAVEGE